MNCHINRWSDDGSIDCVEHLYVMGIDNNDDALMRIIDNDNNDDDDDGQYEWWV